MIQLLAFLQIIQILGRWFWAVFYTYPMGSAGALIIDLFLRLDNEQFISNTTRVLFAGLLVLRWVNYKRDRGNKDQNMPNIHIKNHNYINIEANYITKNQREKGD